MFQCIHRNNSPMFRLQRQYLICRGSNKLNLSNRHSHQPMAVTRAHLLIFLDQLLCRHNSPISLRPLIRSQTIRVPQSRSHPPFRITHRPHRHFKPTPHIHNSKVLQSQHQFRFLVCHQLRLALPFRQSINTHLSPINRPINNQQTKYILADGEGGAQLLMKSRFIAFNLN